MAQKHKPVKTIEVRWQIPENILNGLRAHHLVNGNGKTLMEYVAEALKLFTPEEFRR